MNNHFYVVDFNDEIAKQLALTGGKGSNLVKLTQANFAVPSGFIVTAHAYHAFIQQDPDFYHNLENLIHCDDARLLMLAIELQERLKKLSLPDEITQSIQQKLGHFDNNTYFAVRSSSTMEDLANAAFAGQHDTFLNCKSEQDILAAIKSCFISLWQQRAIAYRQQQGFDHQFATMAVVVQQMIASDVSGVGFSIHPISGHFDQMMLNANFGLGESVVSGESEVDQWIIDKKNLSVIETHIADKKQKIICDKDGGTQHVTMDDTEQQAASLTQQQIEHVASVLKRVEQFYGFPQDIEWAYAQQQFYLLQARPITIIPPRWTRDESAERFPTVITPLAWDFVDEAFHNSLAFSFELMDFPVLKEKWFAIFDNYIYGNQNAVDLYLKKSPFNLENIQDLEKLLPALREKYSWVQELPLIWARNLDRYLLKIGELMAEPVEQYSLEKQWDFVLRVQALGKDYFRPNIAISITQASLYRVLLRLIEFVFPKEKAFELFDAITTFVETKTGLVNKELYELAQLLKTTPALYQTVKQRSSKDILHENILATFPEFFSHWQQFLQDHGHREVEFDPYHATWIDAPSIVLDTILLIAETPNKQSSRDKEREIKIQAHKAEYELLQAIPKQFQFLFYELIRLVRVYTSLDDIEHYQTSRLTLPLRKGLKALGTSFKNKQIIKEELDVFFAHRATLQHAIDNNDFSLLMPEIKTQKAQYQQNKIRTPDWNLGERAAYISVGEYLTGLAASGGVQEGEVFIVHDTDAFKEFPTGAILVSRTTNPAWTPLFYRAKAVVTESGGPLSHAAVIAREMKIPAVLSVKNVLQTLKNGQRIRVDGTLGKVFLI